MYKILIFLTFIISIALGQASPSYQSQFLQNFKKIFQLDISPAPFSISSQSYTSSEFYITIKKSIRPPELKISEISSSNFFDTTTLHQQTQLGFFGFFAKSKKALAFTKKQDILYTISLSEYRNEENESRFLIECTKIDKDIKYYSIVVNRKFDTSEIQKAETLCIIF